MKCEKSFNNVSFNFWEILFKTFYLPWKVCQTRCLANKTITTSKSDLLHALGNSFRFPNSSQGQVKLHLYNQTVNCAARHRWSIWESSLYFVRFLLSGSKISSSCGQSSITPNSNLNWEQAASDLEFFWMLLTLTHNTSTLVFNLWTTSFDLLRLSFSALLLKTFFWTDFCCSFKMKEFLF